jgi:hypothetical protein
VCDLHCVKAYEAGNYTLLLIGYYTVDYIKQNQENVVLIINIIGIKAIQIFEQHKGTKQVLTAVIFM